MAQLAEQMPQVVVPQAELAQWGAQWQGTTNPTTGKAKDAFCFDRQQSVNFASFIDSAFAHSVAEMLGGIPVEVAKRNALLPKVPDCVETGQVRIIGGIRPQNFDVAYRPDGPRVAFDSKTLNDRKSVNKNWQNMVNDLGTEAATVHTRFPYAIVVFVVVIPEPALADKQRTDLLRVLGRLGAGREALDPPHLAEAVSLIVWDPATGQINPETPPADSHLRIERLSDTVYAGYVHRYAGMSPHEE